MNMALPEDQMPEAEVALRLAFFLVGFPGCATEIEVNIDGAQVAVRGAEVFRVREFLESEGWTYAKAPGSKS